MCTFQQAFENISPRYVERFAEKLDSESSERKSNGGKHTLMVYGSAILWPTTTLGDRMEIYVERTKMRVPVERRRLVSGTRNSLSSVIPFQNVHILRICIGELNSLA